VRKVSGAARAREIEVVSSDQSVLRAVAGWGATGTRAPAFLAEVARALDDAPAAEKPEAASPDEIAEWLERFSER